MKKIILVILVLTYATFESKAQKLKGNNAVTKKSSSSCKCVNDKVFINCWKDPADASGNFYILEIQMSFALQQNPAMPNCTYNLDSIFFLQPPAVGVTDRYYAFTEFTTILSKLSTDKKTFIAQYKIPASLYRQPLVINRAMFSQIIMHYGTTRCQLGKDYKITEPLL